MKDNEAVYDAEIAPLITEIIAICKREGIPMAATFEYAPEQYCTTAIPAEGQSERMKRCNKVLTDGIAPAPSFQITTTKADGSKVIEVFIP